MFDVNNLWLFLAATLALNLTPGPDMLYVISRSISQGRKAGIVSSFGIAAGTIVHIVLATLGISAILSYSATAFMVIKTAGALYLIYLGIRGFISFSKVNIESNLKNRSYSQLFWQGMITNTLNPKVALFFLSFLPQFVNHDSGNVSGQILYLGVLFDISGTTVLLLTASLFGFVAVWLEKYSVFDKIQKWFMPISFVGLGIALLFSGNGED